MEVLRNGFTLELSPGAFPLSTDSVALADFVSLPKNAAVLDLGSGCGTLGLMLCAREESCRVTGIEIDPDAHAMALHNRQANRLDSRLASICGDVRRFSEIIKAGAFRVCISNPPYFSGGPAGKNVTERREDLCSLEDLFRAAGWSLCWGGDLFLVHRPERLAEICVLARQNGMEAKKLRLLRHKENGPVTLVLIQCRKGAKPGLIWEEAALHHPDGSPTDYYNSLYGG